MNRTTKSKQTPSPGVKVAHFADSGVSPLPRMGNGNYGSTRETSESSAGFVPGSAGSSSREAPRRSLLLKQMQSSRRRTGRAMQGVQFDPDSHVNVLFQMYGSVWPKVVPFCIANVALTAFVWYMLKIRHVDLTFSDKGHTFMSLMVSFLVVSRAQIVYGRFMEARAHLSNAMRACRELVHHAAILTLYETNDLAKQWRYEVAYRTILLLRVLCAAIEHQSSHKNSWDIPEMDPEHQYQIRKSLILDENDPECSPPRTHHKPAAHAPPPPPLDVMGSPSPIHRLKHGSRTVSDENFRVPVLLSYQLRQAIVSQREGKLSEPLHVNEELKILQFVSEFNVAFHGLRKLITTPFPFPLVQMARTFLFFWVFTLPFSLVGDIQRLFQVLCIIFVLTYGFVGLEYVSMELDDPFGDDPNDFDDLTMSQMVFEDIYITINEIDGRDAADRLRLKVRNKNNVGTDFASFAADDELFTRIGDAPLSAVFEASPLVPKEVSTAADPGSAGGHLQDHFESTL